VREKGRAPLPRPSPLKYLRELSGVPLLSLVHTFRKMINTHQNKKNLRLFLIFYNNRLVIFQLHTGLRHFNMFKILVKKVASCSTPVLFTIEVQGTPVQG
jgi:hypothetical protein